MAPGKRHILLLLLEVYNTITLARDAGRDGSRLLAPFAYFFISTSSPSAQARAAV